MRTSCTHSTGLAGPPECPWGTSWCLSPPGDSAERLKHVHGPPRGRPTGEPSCLPADLGSVCVASATRCCHLPRGPPCGRRWGKPALRRFPVKPPGPPGPCPPLCDGGQPRPALLSGGTGSHRRCAKVRGQTEASTGRSAAERVVSSCVGSRGLGRAEGPSPHSSEGVPTCLQIPVRTELDRQGHPSPRRWRRVAVRGGQRGSPSPGQRRSRPQRARSARASCCRRDWLCLRYPQAPRDGHRDRLHPGRDANLNTANGVTRRPL